MRIGLHRARNLVGKIARLYPPSGGATRAITGQSAARVRGGRFGDASCQRRSRTLEPRVAADSRERARARPRNVGAGALEGSQHAAARRPGGGRGMKATTSVRAPWAPSIDTPSMSPVADGPV